MILDQSFPRVSRMTIKIIVIFYWLRPNRRPVLAKLQSYVLFPLRDKLKDGALRTVLDFENSSKTWPCLLVSTSKRSGLALASNMLSLNLNASLINNNLSIQRMRVVQHFGLRLGSTLGQKASAPDSLDAPNLNAGSIVRCIIKCNR